ncbi:hypothetical protein TIFTF001_048838, partial [Ficus carica]
MPKKLGKKKVDSRTEVQQDAQQQEALFNFNKLNMEMRPLAYYAHSSMRQGNQIEVLIPYTMMGFDMPVFLGFDDIYEFINLQEISANCILVYMRYLEELCRINGQAEKGRHWVLGVIDPWEDFVLYFDHLREKKRDGFTELMNMALTDWKIMAGEGIKRRRDCKMKISNCPCPLQEGSVECGYFVLAATIPYFTASSAMLHHLASQIAARLLTYSIDAELYLPRMLCPMLCCSKSGCSNRLPHAITNDI